MTAHRARYDLADEDPTRVSAENGSIIGDRESWGAVWLVQVDANETRKIVPPHQAGLCMDLSVQADNGTRTCLFQVVGSQTFEDGSGTDLTTTGNATIKLESFHTSNGVRWFRTYEKGTVALTS